MTTCKNCNQDFTGKYCSNCGQSADIHRMNVHFLWHDIQHGLLHMDKGILFTIRELFTRPGHAVREFIEGKRVRHFKPVSLVLVLAGIYGFLYHYFHIEIQGDIHIPGSHGNTLDFHKINDWIGGHYALVSLLQLPVAALGTFLAFKKCGYNYIEHLVLNAYIAGQKLILHILMFPLLYIYNKSQAILIVSSVSDILGFVLVFWTLIQFFNRQEKAKTAGLVIFSYLIYMAAYMLIIAMIAIGIYLGDRLYW